MYALHESGPPGNLKKSIGVYLLQRGTKEYPGWGYKGMSEDMGPCYYDCPLSYLDEADEPSSGLAREWREKVRKLAAERASKRPKVGELWALRNSTIPSVLITSVRPLRGTHQGTLYRIKKALLDHKVLQEAG